MAFPEDFDAGTWLDPETGNHLGLGAGDAGQATILPDQMVYDAFDWLGKFQAQSESRVPTPTAARMLAALEMDATVIHDYSGHVNTLDQVLETHRANCGAAAKFDATVASLLGQPADSLYMEIGWESHFPNSWHRNLTVPDVNKNGNDIMSTLDYGRGSHRGLYETDAATNSPLQQLLPGNGNLAAYPGTTFFMEWTGEAWEILETTTAAPYSNDCPVVDWHTTTADAQGRRNRYLRTIVTPFEYGADTIEMIRAAKNIIMDPVAAPVLGEVAELLFDGPLQNFMLPTWEDKLNQALGKL